MRVLEERFMAEELVRDQYTGRYPFELVQNASDAVAEVEGTHAKVCFVLTDTALLVADQGDGFRADQVEAISGFANSSKDPRKTIGYKGLGFKSVNDITVSPQIFAPAVRFGFDDRKAHNLVHQIVGGDADSLRIPHYRFPFEITLQDAGPDVDVLAALLDDAYTTIIRLPFKQGITRTLVETDLLDTLHPRLLLFLDSLEQMELRGTTGDFTATIARYPGTDFSEALLESAGHDEHFLLFSSIRPISDRSLVSELGGAWEQVDRVRVFAAVPLDAEQLPSVEASHPLHVYFPTEEQIGLPMILSADFQMEFDRRRVASTPKSDRYNEWLLGELADFLTGHVLDTLTRRFPGNPRVASAYVYPESGEKLSGMLRRLVIDRLSGAEYVPCVDGSIRRPRETRLLPVSVPDSQFLQPLLPNLHNLVHADLDADSSTHEFLVKEVGAAQADIRYVLTHLVIPDDMCAEPFYEFLVEWWRHTTHYEDHLMAAAPIVRLINGTWVTPSEALLPRQRDEIDFPPGLSVPIADLPEVDDLDTLMEQVGLRPFEWRHVVADHLMPILSDSTASKEVWQGAMAALRHYYDSGGRDVRIRQDASSTLLPVRNAADTRTARQAASRVYFDDEWIPGTGLCTLYGATEEPEFLAEPLPTNAEELAAEIGFYRWLGVEDKPRVYRTAAAGPAYTQPHDWRSSAAWNRDPEHLAALECGQGHSKSQTLDSAPWIDRLDDVVLSGDTVRLTHLWALLARNWEHFAPTMNARYRCTASRHPGERDRVFPSLTASVLRTTAWIPSLRNGSPTVETPRAVWMPSARTPTPLQSAVPVPLPNLVKCPPAMLQALGIVDADRPAADDLIDLLRRLAEDDCLTKDIEAIARWAMRKLDEVAGDIGVDDIGQIPLLAQLNGQPIFDYQPYTTSDRLAATTWRDSIPIFDGDRRLKDLKDVLGLPDLDMSMRAEPQLMQRDSLAESRTGAFINSAKPHLLAIAAELARSEQDDIAKALNRLQIACGYQLSLTYRFEGESRTAQGITTYLQSSNSEGTVDAEIAYFAPDETGGIDWLSFGPQLARYIGYEELGDSFALLLSNEEDARRRYLESRGISDEDVAASLAVLLAQVEASTIESDHLEVSSQQSPSTDPSGLSSAPLDELSRPGARGGQRRPPEREAKGGIGIDPTSSPVQNGAKDEPETETVAPQRDAYPAAARPTPVDIDDDPVSSDGNTKTSDSRQGRFFSYVVSGDGPPRAQPEQSTLMKQETDRRGIEHVVAFEISANRVPEVKPQNNPGFDIESRGPDGTVARTIEVKSLSGAWGDKGVTMSKRQLEANQFLKDHFWLYVVEYATDDARARVIPVHNPYEHAGTFVFDDGWRALAETPKEFER